jgi:AcrR family transcriptional regulator
VTEKRSTDRRVERTQSHLREALVSLIGEKSYDAIVVKEILGRANVGRSTFYTHFRDKDDLLASGIHDMLRGAYSPVGPDSTKHSDRVLRFSLPVFQYIDQHRKETAGRKVRGRGDVHERLRLVLAELIADEVRKDSVGRGTAGRIPPDLVGQHVASTFTMVLNWWVESGSHLAAEDVNQFFRTLVVPTLASILEQERR